MSSMLENMIRMGMLCDSDSRGVCPNQEKPPQPKSAPRQDPIPHVSTLLDISITDVDSPEDIIIERKAYRRLTPDYFAWLRSRMVSAQAAHKAEKLSDSAWETLRERFNSLQEMAIEGLR